jgi:hypothetical protein
MQASERLAELDQRFVDIYEAARARTVERQKQIALIVIQCPPCILAEINQFVRVLLAASR